MKPRQSQREGLEAHGAARGPQACRGRGAAHGAATASAPKMRRLPRVAALAPSRAVLRPRLALRRPLLEPRASLRTARRAAGHAEHRHLLLVVL